MFCLFILLCLLVYFLVFYKSREKMSSNQNIIISMTTSPTRIDKIEHILETFNNQTVKPTKLILNLPFVFKRTQQTFDNIPSFISKYSFVDINRCEDIGPCTKIIPTVELFNNQPETIIISIDDDIAYTNTFIETFLEYSNKNPNAVITGQSFLRIPKSNQAKLVEGYSGVLYKQKFLKNFDIEQLKQYPKVCYFADDFILSNYLLKNKIPIVVIGDLDKIASNIYLDYGSKNDALKAGADGYTIDNMDNYKKCYEYLKQTNDSYLDI